MTGTIMNDFCIVITGMPEYPSILQSDTHKEFELRYGLNLIKRPVRAICLLSECSLDDDLPKEYKSKRIVYWFFNCADMESVYRKMKIDMIALNFMVRYNEHNYCLKVERYSINTPLMYDIANKSDIECSSGKDVINFFRNVSSNGETIIISFGEDINGKRSTVVSSRNCQGDIMEWDQKKMTIDFEK